MSETKCRRTTSRLWAVAAAMLFAPAAGGWSDTVDVSTEIPVLSAEIPVAVTDGRLPLSLEDAIHIALERNLGLIVRRYNEKENRLNLSGAHGIYDLLGTADLNAFDETTPSASNLDGADIQTTEGQSWNFGLSRLLATGASVSLDFDTSRRETNSTFSTLNPSYRSDFDLSIRQPLLKGLGKRITERNILVAQTNLEITRESFSQQVSSTIQQVVNAYWALVGNRNGLTVAERSLSLAEQLHEQNKIRVEVGTLAPLELVQSEAGIATRKEAIIRQRAAVGDAEDTLRQLLNLDRTSLWDTAIETTTEAGVPERTVVNLEAAIEAALQDRPELTSQRLALDNLEVDVEYFDNQRLPQLDFTARYGFNGLGGPVTERDFFTGEILFQAPGDYGDALSQITDGEFAGWSVGLNLSYPFQNRTAEAQSARAEVVLERGRAELRELELQVVTEVRRAARALETSGQQIDSAAVSRRLAERNLEAEQKRYDNGLSTSYRVLEIQRDLTDAEIREIAAVYGYQTALAELQRATASLNEESGVAIVTAGDD